MSNPRFTPVLVGVGEVCNRSKRIEDAVEPLDLIFQAVQDAIGDMDCSQTNIAEHIDSISIVPPWSWPYPNLPGSLAEKLGAKPTHLVQGTHGGHQPALQCDEAARRLSKGESKMAIIAGGEALASLAAFQKEGRLPFKEWTKPETGRQTIDPSDMKARSRDIGTRHSMGLPIHVYPMYEAGFRHHEGLSPQQNNRDSAHMYSAFDEIACKHKKSWRYGCNPRSPEAIGTVSQGNRMICSPYPLLMNAFNTVNLAAACILMTTEFADQIGIPHHKRVHVLGGAGTADNQHFWKRNNYFSSQPLEKSLDAALAASQLTVDDVDAFDFYSCFPIVPKFACKHLGLDAVNPQKPITLLGGLTSFGGAGNNYSMHAIAEMVRHIRDRKITNGLILANGGVMTHEHAICLSANHRSGPDVYPQTNRLSAALETITAKAPLFIEHADGRAKIETYTVEFDRDGSPRIGLIVGRLDASGHRFIANHGDSRTLNMLANNDMDSIGRLGVVKMADDGRNVFHMDPAGKL